MPTAKKEPYLVEATGQRAREWWYLAPASAGLCRIEFGHDQVGRVDVNFLSGPEPSGTFQAQSAALVAEKVHLGSSRVQRWFGREWSAKG